MSNKISKKALEQFKKIYEAEFKERISYRRAEIMAERLLKLYMSVFTPTLKN
ncbi:MAG: hypothetical protein NTW11_00510 [Candidatus Staskawiczbacteria bacterium]|nr:hypothetical protein [Candidatus Staskawiczbacteria bacterium]